VKVKKCLQDESKAKPNHKLRKMKTA